MKPTGRTADPPKGIKEGDIQRTECPGGTGHVAQTGLCKSRSCHRGRLEREVQSLEIDARRRKPQQAARPEAAQAGEGRKTGRCFGNGRSGRKALRRRKTEGRKQLRLRRVQARKAKAGRAGAEEAQASEADEETGATLWNRKAERRR